MSSESRLWTRDGARPSASVIITCYNEGARLGDTIDSVLANSQDRIELIIVDDASSDGCCDNITQFDRNDGQSLRIVRHQQRMGVAPSRHRASEIATGQVLIFLDGHTHHIAARTRLCNSALRL